MVAQQVRYLDGKKVLEFFHANNIVGVLVIFDEQPLIPKLISYKDYSEMKLEVKNEGVE